MSEETPKKTNFIRQIIEADLASGKHQGVVTRFPPEPNGYPHIGHAKSICLNFGLAKDFGGKCHLRFDDTNPVKEDQEFVDAIMDDVRWLGFDWGKNLFHASDYFGKLYEYAQHLIREGKAYVCELSAEDMRKTRGTLTEAGTPSPFRDRPAQESLDLLERMKKGEFEEGRYTLRAKIDMASPNMNLRDPAVYRIRKATHQRTGDEWCIYPMYDFAHGLSDAIEGITHSNCTLEFEDHRPLYDWYLDQLPVDCHPQQIEFAPLNIDYTLLSKRNLRTLVEEGKVSGWDDPRMPTLRGLRRRGFTPAGIRNFCERIGVTKKNSRIELSTLENCVREDLNEVAARAMVVLDPLKVVVTNYPEGQTEEVDAKNHPQKPELGTRKVPFGRELYIEREDFMEDAPKKFFRLAPGREVRFKYAYYLTCTEVVKDAQGNITEVHCTYDPETKGGDSADGRKVKGTIHWVSAHGARDARVRLYDRLFQDPDPAALDDFHAGLNPNSLKEVTAKVEPMLLECKAEDRFQFERLGYFVADRVEHGSGAAVFNRIVTLRDSWAKAKA